MPELDVGAMRILHAYDELATERPPAALGIAQIPRRAVTEWARDHDLGPEASAHLWQVIRIVDAAVIRRVNALSNGGSP